MTIGFTIAPRTTHIKQKGLPMGFLEYETPYLYDVDHVISEDCWCEPEIVETGDMVVILQHRRGVC